MGVDHRRKTVEHQTKSIRVQIWDTAGQVRFRQQCESYFKGAVGIILVYDVTDAKSYENIEYWLNKVKEIGGNNIEIILIGNKIDMRNEVDFDQQ